MSLPVHSRSWELLLFPELTWLHSFIAAAMRSCLRRTDGRTLEALGKEVFAGLFPDLPKDVAVRCAKRASVSRLVRHDDLCSGSRATWSGPQRCGKTSGAEHRCSPPNSQRGAQARVPCRIACQMAMQITPCGLKVWLYGPHCLSAV